VVLVGGFALASGSGDDEPQPTEPTTTVAPETNASAATAPRETQPPPPPPPRVETIRIRDRAPVGDPPTLEFDSGDTVRLRFRSNVAEEVHIHGFDRYVDVPAGGVKTDRFEADIEGIFEIESHGSGELLAKLRINP
jgi:FtsP/CotA-like multicopper oxidase with cupredoxin domain